MPITKSAKKALRKDIKRHKRNLAWKKKIKSLQKEIKKLLEKKEIEKAKKLLPQFYKIVDKAAKNNVIKKNTAARKKSRLSRLITQYTRENKVSKSNKTTPK
ncbi:30S ribosomal protein S20 [bacterium]|nr:30S ribosomal protein S20 [bacterium]